MATTANDLITDVLTVIGELGQGQTASPEDGAFCLVRVNAVLDSWSQEEDYIFNRTTVPYALTSNVGVYPIGPTAGAPFNVARPNKIDAARILILVGGVYIGVKDMRLIGYDEYVSYSDKSSTSIVPEVLYYDNAVPNGNLYLFDIPSVPVGTKLELTTWTQLPQFASLATPFVFPPGYYEAIVQALAVAISPGYNKPVDQVTAGRAAQCTQRIKEINRMILRPGAPAPAAPGQQQAQAAQALQSLQ